MTFSVTFDQTGILRAKNNRAWNQYCTKFIMLDLTDMRAFVRKPLCTEEKYMYLFPLCRVYEVLHSRQANEHHNFTLRNLNDEQYFYKKSLCNRYNFTIQNSDCNYYSFVYKTCTARKVTCCFAYVLQCTHVIVFSFMHNIKIREHSIAENSRYFFPQLLSTFTLSFYHFPHLK